MLDAVRSCQICSHHTSPSMSLLLQRGFVPIGHNDVCAFLGEQVGGGFADTVRAGIDKRVFSLDPIIHSLLDSWIVERPEL